MYCGLGYLVPYISIYDAIIRLGLCIFCYRICSYLSLQLFRNFLLIILIFYVLMTKCVCRNYSFDRKYSHRFRSNNLVQLFRNFLLTLLLNIATEKYLSCFFPKMLKKVSSQLNNYFFCD